MNRFHAIAGSLTSVWLVTSPGFAADPNSLEAPSNQQCAVSGVNGKIEGAAGKIDTNAQDGGRYHVAGSITAPLNCLIGLQLDGSVGELDGQSAWGIAGHVFTRDPNSYLFGAYAEVAAIGNNDIGRFALEGELYRGRMTFSGLAGVEDSDFTSSEFFGIGQLSYYLNDNFVINGGVAHFLDTTNATAGFEWQPDETNFSFFANAGFGDNDHASVYGGVRFYFGEQKSLIRRHREDDPVNWINILQTIAPNPALCVPPAVLTMEGCRVLTMDTVIVSADE